MADHSRTHPPLSAASAAGPSGACATPIRTAVHSHDSADSSDEDGRTENGQRKIFRRSRGGCSGCRQAKKKCSQQRPACDRCRASNKACLYPEPIVWTAAAGGSGTGELNVQPRFDGHHVAGTGFETQMRMSQMPRGPDISDISHSPTISFPPLASQHSNSNPPTLSPQTSFVPDTYQQTAFFGDVNNGVQALFSVSHTQNLTGDPAFSFGSSNNNGATSSGDGPLSVPIDCDPALWSFFVDSSNWQEEQPIEDEGGLLDHYQRHASFGVVIQDGPARHFFSDCASRASREKGRALMHAVLCVSAQHLSNKARTENDKAKMTRYRDISIQHRSQSLHLLRVAAADRSNVDAEVLPAIMILLILAANLRGESGVIPSFLERTTTLLENAVNPADAVFIPSVSALHSMYQAFYSLSAQKQIDLKSLFPNRDARPVWEERCQGVLETVTGMRKEVFMMVLKANELVLEYKTIEQALERDEADEELRMMQMELLARGSAMEADLEDDEGWAEKHLEGRVERTKVGHNCCRIAVRAMILSDIRHLPNTHPMVMGLVQAFVEQLDECAPQLEVGLSWPFIITASCATPALRPRCSAFISRAQWKGSAMPRTAQGIVEEVWREQDSGGKRTWRDFILARGSPIII